MFDIAIMSFFFKPLGFVPFMQMKL